MSERDQKLDAKYQELVPYLGQEHIIQKGAITKEMNTFELEAFEVSNQTPSKLDIDLHAIFNMCECFEKCQNLSLCSLYYGLYLMSSSVYSISMFEMCCKQCTKEQTWLLFLYCSLLKNACKLSKQFLISLQSPYEQYLPQPDRAWHILTHWI